MFFLHHPQPVRPRKAVPEQQVSSQQFVQVDTRTIIVENSKEELLALQLKTRDGFAKK
ncbi:hypothetical protein [Undibacterium sp. TS12]|uniref:hypothetical protein n=1 Tax=Undibacterium sp. TS12 TaxID=2908202 RepID=UPI001F4C8FE4|nr:hypothetical protein [Undibacterium sp. TS12]MCH8620875.1 hypothetical protein [Undibacterium sp. TS12]